MLTQWLQKGDLIFYHRVQTLGESLIDAGEIIEGGPQPTIAYHVAIALDSYTKIEAIMPQGVTTNSILYDGSWGAVRLPLTPQQINRGIAAIKADIGQKYDKVLIVDDGLRDLSMAFFHSECLHLPKWLVRREERLQKVCITLALAFMDAAPWHPPDCALDINSSPQDGWIITKPWRIGN